MAEKKSPAPFGRTDDGAPAAPSPAQGTTHDPNSVTTGTDMEPDDRYPPKGERDGLAGEDGRDEEE